MSTERHCITSLFCRHDGAVASCSPADATLHPAEKALHYTADQPGILVPQREGLSIFSLRYSLVFVPDITILREGKNGCPSKSTGGSLGTLSKLYWACKKMLPLQEGLDETRSWRLLEAYVSTSATRAL